MENLKVMTVSGMVKIAVLTRAMLAPVRLCGT